jgi:BirA family biotin operon repressor/biotin-[acetyl-CoA-carboxylase] ligase
MNKIIDNINIKISCVELGNFNLIHNQYHEVLFRKGIPTTFLNQKTNQLFMGMIHGVTSSGDIQIQLEDNTIREFRLKEISFAKV